MDKLKLQVLLDMADRVSAPLKRIGSGARNLGRDLDEAQKALRGLERQQAAVAKYRGMQEGLRDTKARLDAARTSQQALVAELKKGGDAAKAVGPQYRAANDAVNKLTQAYGRQHLCRTPNYGCRRGPRQLIHGARRRDAGHCTPGARRA